MPAMRLASLTALSLVFAAACGGPPKPSELPPDVVLSYNVSHMGGGVTFTVRSNRTATYEASEGRGPATRIEGAVTEQALDAMTSTLRKADFCDLRSSRKNGVPDEARPSIAIHMGKFDCRVTLWDNEYDQSPWRT